MQNMELHRAEMRALRRGRRARELRPRAAASGAVLCVAAGIYLFIICNLSRGAVRLRRTLRHTFWSGCGKNALCIHPKHPVVGCAARSTCWRCSAASCCWRPYRGRSSGRPPPLLDPLPDRAVRGLRALSARLLRAVGLGPGKGRYFLRNCWFLLLSIPYLNIFGGASLSRDWAMLLGIIPLLRAFLALYVVVRWLVDNRDPPALHGLCLHGHRLHLHLGPSSSTTTRCWLMTASTASATPSGGPG